MTPALASAIGIPHHRNPTLGLAPKFIVRSRQRILSMSSLNLRLANCCFPQKSAIRHTQVLDGRAHPARVASDGSASGSRARSARDIFTLTRCQTSAPRFGIWKGLTIAAAQAAARRQPTRNFAGNGDIPAAGHAERHLRSTSGCNAQTVFARG